MAAAHRACMRIAGAKYSEVLWKWYEEREILVISFGVIQQQYQRTVPSRGIPTSCPTGEAGHLADSSPASAGGL